MPKKKVKCYDCGFLSLHGSEDSLLESGKEQGLRSVLIGMEIAEKLDLIGLAEIKTAGRGKIINGTINPVELTCARNVWTRRDIREMSKNQALGFLCMERKCPFFFPYHPSYKPREHLELQREFAQRQFLIKVSVISACVGAGIATLVNLVWSRM